MALNDAEILERRYGYAALFLRRTLYATLPETKNKNNVIISLMEDTGAMKPGELDSGTLSKWLTGKSPCNTVAVRGLLSRKSDLTPDDLASIIRSLEYLIENAKSLPELVRLPEPPELARRMIEKFQPLRDNLRSSDNSDFSKAPSALVENIFADDVTIGDVIAESGGTSAVENIEARLFETGDVHASNGAVARISNLRGTSIKIGNVRAGVKSGKKS